MGYYDKTEKTLNRRPVYKQREGTQYLYYYEEDGRWYVGYDTLGEAKAYFYVTSTAATPASTGWKYWGGGKWRTDSTLRLDTSPSDPSSTYTSIKVAATGQAVVFAALNQTKPNQTAGSVQGRRMGNYEW